MSRDEIINALMILYSHRVKSLLSINEDYFVRELLELMFKRFDEISKMPTHLFYTHEMEERIGNILQTQTGIKASQEDMRNLINRLEEYIQLNIKKFWPNKTFTFNPHIPHEGKEKQDYRKFLGMKIREIAEDTTGKYTLPIVLDTQTTVKIYKQLYQVTQMRNRFTHLIGAGASVMYTRCHFLQMSEILLSYILHTYYYKCLFMNKELLTD